MYNIRQPALQIAAPSINELMTLRVNRVNFFCYVLKLAPNYISDFLQFLLIAVIFISKVVHKQIFVCFYMLCNKAEIANYARSSSPYSCGKKQTISAFYGINEGK